MILANSAAASNGLPRGRDHAAYQISVLTSRSVRGRLPRRARIPPKPTADKFAAPLAPGRRKRQKKKEAQIEPAGRRCTQADMAHAARNAVGARTRPSRSEGLLGQLGVRAVGRAG